jgi:hypothetical protein
MDIVKSKWARFFFFPLLLLFFLELTLSYFIFLDIAENSRQLLEIESKIKLCQSAPPDLSNSVNYVLKGLEEKNAYAPAEGSSVKKASQTVFPENISELFLQNNTFSKASATIDRKKFRVLFPEGWHFLIVCRLKLAADLGCLQNEQLLAALEKI